MYINTTGLVLRETRYKDSSKILTVLTSGEGKLTVTARGALRRNSKLMAVTQLLSFSHMTLFSKNDRWTLTEAQSIEEFQGLSHDIVLLALGSYFAELTEAVADEDSPNPDILPLCLNALYALSSGAKEPEYVKPAFELRLLADSGFAPLADSCVVCGQRDLERAYLDLQGGTIRCCGGADYGREEAQLTIGALEALRYIISCDPKKLFSFTLGEAALKELTRAAEGYLLFHLDRGFRTLDYYKSLGNVT
ncbi:MAG: DNA repair protein RecO [Oscillospiraceae bacterium]|nr:DNA repair protein RecO [Oscillospiraceae bacterium]